MEIKHLKISSVKPYKKNAKKHPDEQVALIANSIKEFGWQQPIVVDKDNNIVIGHGRYLAAKKLGLQEAPCICASDLTEQQIKALRLADNKVAESEWDNKLLELELADIIDLDMEDYGFDLDLSAEIITAEDSEDGEGQPDEWVHNVFENQEKMQFETDSYYGMPKIKPTQTYGDRLVRFCDWRGCDSPQEFIAHFFYSDFKFMAAWRNPDKYIDRLKAFKAVVSPDFSVYTDFPRALQILACYRRQWCGAYWQANGIDVIPDVRWGDEKSYDYCFDGIPSGGTVAVSRVGVTKDSDWNGKEDDLFRKGYEEMLKRLNPTTVIFYGTKMDGLEGNIIYVPSYYDEFREKRQGE